MLLFFHQNDKQSVTVERSLVTRKWNCSEKGAFIVSVPVWPEAFTSTCRLTLAAGNDVHFFVDTEIQISRHLPLVNCHDDVRSTDFYENIDESGSKVVKYKKKTKKKTKKKHKLV